jgi:DNA-directed RNA polymerase subunit beta
VPFDQIVGRFVAKDIINEETGAIYVEAGDELTWEARQGRRGFRRHAEGTDRRGHHRDPGARHRQHQSAPTSATPWRSDKNLNRDTALMDIYRVMRPGEPPTVDAASTLFDQLFFDSPSATTCPPSAA